MGCKENFCLIISISFLGACALSRARNQESRLGFPEINEKCFSWSNIFQPSCLEDPNNHTQNLFARKQCLPGAGEVPARDSWVSSGAIGEWPQFCFVYVS